MPRLPLHIVLLIHLPTPPSLPSLTHARTTPNRAPEEIFAKRSFSTGNDGTATVDADYNIDTQQLNVATVWKNGQGLSVSAAGNNKDKVTKIGAETSTTVSGHSLNLAAAYDLLTKKVSTNTRLTVDDTKIQLKYDNADRDPVVEINHKLDDKNTVSPSISLKSGGMTYGWLRKINGGTIGATLHPGDKVEINWEDNGANGVWKTKAEVPLEDHSATKISFSRDWNY